MRRYIRKLKGAFRDPIRAMRILVVEGVHKLLVRIMYAFQTSCSFTIRDVHVTFDTSDTYSKEWFFPRCANGTYHEPAVTYLIEKLMGVCPSFVDVGAHLGYFSIIVAKLCPNKPVLAYEMDDRAFKRLVKNANANDIPNLSLFQKAITASSGSVSYRRLPMLDSGESIAFAGSDDPSRTVESQSLDDAFSTTGIPVGLIKIDVEGADYDVLTGMEETLQKQPTLLLEIHGTKLPLFSSNSQKVIQFLEAREYHVYEIQNHRSDQKPRLSRLSGDMAPFPRNTMTLVVHATNTIVLNTLKKAGAL